MVEGYDIPLLVEHVNAELPVVNERDVLHRDRTDVQIEIDVWDKMFGQALRMDEEVFGVVPARLEGPLVLIAEGVNAPIAVVPLERVVSLAFFFGHLHGLSPLGASEDTTPPPVVVPALLMVGGLADTTTDK